MVQNSILCKPRMAADVYHPCVHLFTSYWLADQVSNAASAIKKLVLGSESAATCYKGPKGFGQMAVQTEFNVTEFSGHSKISDAFDLMDQRLDALFDAGLAVHLLLMPQDIPKAGWLGVDWQAFVDAWPGGGFDPYQPSLKENTDGQQNPYDIVAENFLKPMIEHLVETGRAEKLAVIYVMNEFGYPPNELLDSASNWDNVDDWKNVRAQALCDTAERVLKVARKAADGTVNVGLKFASVTSPNTGWAPFSNQDPDQLSTILNVMSDKGDNLGYDAYYTDDSYDALDHTRLSPFLGMFKDGKFELSETARWCTGCPGEFKTGCRTSVADITGSASLWSEAQGYNLFAWNVGGCDDGCMAMADGENVPYPGVDQEGQGLWALFQAATGSSDPSPVES